MFSYLFPKGSLGIEITTKYVRFVHLTQKRDVFHIENFGRILVPQDTFQDGVLKKPEYLRAIFKKILQESSEREIRVSLPGESQQFFLLMIPKGGKDSLVDEIVFALKENVLFHEGRDEIVDVRILGEEEGSITVRAVSASLSWYKHMRETLDILRKKNLHIERASQSAITASLSHSARMPRLHIQFGDDMSSYSIVDHGKVVRYQEFPFSTHRFLLEVQKRLTKPSAVASSYLAHLGILGADVRDFGEEVIRPIAFIVDHAMTEFGRDTGKAIQEVSLGGVFGGYKGVSLLFSKHLRISVHSAYPWKTFDPRFDDSIFDMKKSESLEYLSALGLAIDGMQ